MQIPRLVLIVNTQALMTNASSFEFFTGFQHRHNHNPWVYRARRDSCPPPLPPPRKLYRSRTWSNFKCKFEIMVSGVRQTMQYAISVIRAATMLNKSNYLIKHEGTISQWRPTINYIHVLGIFINVCRATIWKEKSDLESNVRYF